jgi:branched-chain amino acid transport system permease protein
MRRITQLLPFIGFIAVAIGVQLIMRATKTEYCLTQLTMSLYYSMVGMALCLVMGYAGQVSLGHGAFFAIGGFTTAVLTTFDFTPLKDRAIVAALKNIGYLAAHEDALANQVLTATPWAAFATALLLVFVIALLIGWPALRLKGQYLAMATLGFGLIIHKIILGTALLGATDGITSVPEW